MYLAKFKKHASLLRFLAAVRLKISGLNDKDQHYKESSRAVLSGVSQNLSGMLPCAHSARLLSYPRGVEL